MNIQNIKPGDKVVVPIVETIRNKTQIQNIFPFEIKFEELELYERDNGRNEVTLLKSIGDRHALCKVPIEAIFLSKEDAVKATVHELEAFIFMLNKSPEKGETA